jgi:hypothetical protein
LIDLNPDAKIHASYEINVLNINILKIEEQVKVEQKFNTIFISNFFEHLANKEELIQVIKFCYDFLHPNGSLLIIQPNFKYSYREYYDFIDHQLPITHISLKEILKTTGFKIDVLIPRFLPFSTKGRPASPQLLKIYLRLPLLWHFLGAQMFIKASKL